MSVSTSVLTSQGPRNYNEDRYCIQAINRGHFVVAVFDGHGGKDCAEMCAQLMPGILRELIVFHPADESTVIRQLYKKLDELALSKGYVTQGCCAAIALIGKQRTWFSNCGDSMIACKMKSHKEALLVSEEHKVENEKERIAELGGIITYWDGCARVFGSLNIGRSIGDHSLKKYVISDPYIASAKTMDLDWICLASDGLWDVCTAERYNNDFEEAMKASASTSDAIGKVMQQAYQRGSTDNMTVVHCTMHGMVPTPYPSPTGANSHVSEAKKD